MLAELEKFQRVWEIWETMEWEERQRLLEWLISQQAGKRVAFATLGSETK